MTEAPPRPAHPRGRQGERSEATSNRILEATVACIVELGHARTSTLVVQERAGVSRGALLHHFPSRAELMAATVDHLFHQMWSTIDVTGNRNANPIERAVRILWASFTSNLAVAAQELMTAARTDSELRAALVQHEAHLNRTIRSQFAVIFGPEITAHPHFDDMFRLLVQAMRGAAAHRSLHAETSARGDLARWVEMATRMLSTEAPR